MLLFSRENLTTTTGEVAGPEEEPNAAVHKAASDTTSSRGQGLEREREKEREKHRGEETKRAEVPTAPETDVR